MKLKVLCVIPARLQSTRLPRKMLQLVQGQPMVQKTYCAARDCVDIDKTIVATDNEEIAKVVYEVDGEVSMTPSDLQTGSDRVAFVAQQFPEYDVIVNLQGDEPFIQTQMLSELLQPYKNGENPPMATLAYALQSEAEFQDPNFVKVIYDTQGYAIYFSRSPIPYFRVKNPAPVLHHMGLYAYQRAFLLHYTSLPQTPLEKIESLEQLRALEHGFKIRVTETKLRTLEINTPEELALAQNFVG
jgi:3-deoxy-manno-octulosonate cytidylyltransferase (CMP-KDO synthetase)